MDDEPAFKLATLLRSDGEVNKEALMDGLSGCKYRLDSLELKGRLLTHLLPNEPEIEAAMQLAIVEVKEALGAVWLFLQNQADRESLLVWADLLSRGTTTLLSSQRTLEALLAPQSDFSQSPSLTALHRAGSDSELRDLALSVLLQEQASRLDRVRELERFFAPHSWRERCLLPLFDVLEKMAGGVDSFTVAAFTSRQLLDFQSLMADFENLIQKARETRPSMDDIRPPVLKEFVSLLGEVYEGREALETLKLELPGFVEGLKDSERDLVLHIVQHDDIAHFPVLWDKLLDSEYGRDEGCGSHHH